MPQTHAERGSAPDSPGRKPPARRQARNTVVRAATAARGARSSAAIHAVQHTAGNAAMQRMLASPTGPSPTTDSGSGASGGGALPVQRLWSQKEFAKQTYEGVLVRRSAAQATIDTLLEEYHALAGAKKPDGFKQLSLLNQMQQSAEFWIFDHTAELDNETVEDPKRKKRMAGMRRFLVDVASEETSVRQAMKNRGEEPGAFERVERGDKRERKAFRKLREKFEGSANSVFTRLGGLIDSAVPNKGDSADLNVELKIPVSPTGFVGGNLSASVSHSDEDMILARTELTVTGGMDIDVASWKVEAGGYVSASAPSGTAVMNLFSYGLYRRFRESKVIPRELTNYMWGGRKGSFGKTKSERWSRDMETALFKALPEPVRTDPKYKDMPKEKADKAFAEDKARAERSREQVRQTYVETGGVIGAGGKVKIRELAGIALSASYESGRRITALSIKEVKEIGGKNKSRPKNRFGRGAQEQLGESTRALSVTAAITSGPVSGSMGIKWAPRNVDVNIDGKFAMPADKLLAHGCGSYIALTLAFANKVMRSVADEKIESQTRSGQEAGRLVGMGEDLALTITQLAHVPKEKFKPKFEAPKEKPGLDATIGLAVGIGIHADKGDSNRYKVTGGSFELNFEKEASLTLPTALSVKLSTKSRLLSIEKSESGWEVK